MERRRAYASLSFLLCLLFMIAFSPVSTGELSREEFEFVIEGELQVEEELAPESPPPSSPSPSPSGSGSSDSGSHSSASSSGPAPEPASSGDTSSPAPTSEPVFDAPQPFILRNNFDDRRSDVPLDSPAGQFLMANVYGGSPNSTALQGRGWGSVTPPLPSPQRPSTPTTSNLTSQRTKPSVNSPIVGLIANIIKSLFRLF